MDSVGAGSLSDGGKGVKDPVNGAGPFAAALIEGEAVDAPCAFQCHRPLTDAAQKFLSAVYGGSSGACKGDVWTILLMVLIPHSRITYSRIPPFRSMHSRIMHSLTTCSLPLLPRVQRQRDRKSTRLNSSHVAISYAVFCSKNKTQPKKTQTNRA